MSEIFQTVFLTNEKAVECLFSQAPPIQGDVQIIVRHRSVKTILLIIRENKEWPCVVY
jgi:hypothetical protein